MPQHEETCKKIGDALASMLLNLSEEKSEPFLMTKRASNGWTAWSRVNKWHIASNIRTCARRQDCSSNETSTIKEG